MELRPHQARAVKKMRNGSILWGGVGSGKTITALYYYKEFEAPKPLYVITAARKRDDLDWEKEAYTQLIEPTVDSWQNIKKYEGVEDAFFIFDEQRVVGSGAWYKAFIKIAKKNRWILLSATPGDTWIDYVAVFVANGYYRNRTDFVQQHVIYSAWSKFPKIDRYVGTGKLIRHRNDILVHMPYARHTTRHLRTLKVNYNPELFRKVLKERWHVFEDRPIRNVAELFSVMRKVVNSDSSRIASVENLLIEHSKVIVFYNFDYELEMLRSLTEQPNSQLTTGCESKRTESCQTQTPVDTTSLYPVQQSPLPEELRGCALAVESDSQWPIETERTTNSTWTTMCTCTTPTGDTTVPETTERSTENSSSANTPTTVPNADAKERSESCVDTVDNTTIEGLSKSSESSSTKSSTGECEKKTSELTSKNSTPTCSDRGSGTGGTSEHSSTETNTQRVGSSPRRVRTSKSEEAGITTAELSTGKDSSLKGLSDVVIAEWNGHKHEPIPDSERWIYLVQYAAGAEAWNCIDTDTVIFFSLNYSYKLFEQAQGRIDRLNTPFEDLNYYILKSDSAIDNAIWKALGKKKSFNESDFMPKEGENG